MTVYEFEHVLKSYGFVKNDNRHGDETGIYPCGDGWWTYDGPFIRNNFIMIDPEVEAFEIYETVSFNDGGIFFCINESTDVKTLQDLSEKLPKIVCKIKSAIKTIRKYKIEEL